MECKDFNLPPLRKVKVLTWCRQAFSAKWHDWWYSGLLSYSKLLTCWNFFFSQKLVGFPLFLNSEIEPDLRSVHVYLSPVFWMAFWWEAVSIFLVTISLSSALFSHFRAVFRYQPPNITMLLNFSHMCLRHSQKFTLNLAPRLSSNEHFSKSLFLQCSLSPNFIVLLIACQKTKNSLLFSIF